MAPLKINKCFLPNLQSSQIKLNRGKGDEAFVLSGGLHVGVISPASKKFVAFVKGMKWNSSFPICKTSGLSESIRKGAGRGEGNQRAQDGYLCWVMCDADSVRHAMEHRRNGT